MHRTISTRPFTLLEVLIVMALIAITAVFIRIPKGETNDSRQDISEELARLREEPIQSRYTDEITPKYPL